MVNAKELRKTLGRTMGKGEPSRPARSKTRGTSHPQERVVPPASSGTRGEERVSCAREQEQAPSMVNIEEHEEEERAEDQLDTCRRREKRAREEVLVPSSPDAREQAAQATLNKGQPRKSGFLDSAVARDHIKTVMKEEDSSWMADKRHEEMFELAFHNSYKATLLTAEATARAYRMARLSRREHAKCAELGETVKTLEGRLKKAEHEKKEAEVKQGLAESTLALSHDRVKELEGDIGLREGRIDELNHMVARLEASRPRIEKEAVDSFLKTEDFKEMVRVDSATAYSIGFNKCLKVLRKYYLDVDQSVLSFMEPSSDEEEEEEEAGPVQNPAPLNVVLPSPHATSKEN